VITKLFLKDHVAL